jgi:hypothetical protein
MIDHHLELQAIMLASAICASALRGEFAAHQSARRVQYLSITFSIICADLAHACEAMEG